MTTPLNALSDALAKAIRDAADASDEYDGEDYISFESVVDLAVDVVAAWLDDQTEAVAEALGGMAEVNGGELEPFTSLYNEHGLAIIAINALKERAK